MATVAEKGGTRPAESGGLGALLQPVLHLVPNLLEPPMRWLQRKLGPQRIAWVFLAPNLVIFGLFTFLPILLNVGYAVTGGENILLRDRALVDGDNFATLLSCKSYVDPGTCRNDLFWRSVYNTGLFVLLQVTSMVLIALLTAIVLNREIRARGFFRAAFFYPVLLSPVVVALVWKWILQREGILNGWFVGLGWEPVNWLL